MIDEGELKAYLLRNGVTGPIVAKIFLLKEMAESICEDIEDYVLSESFVSGRKLIDSIWFFSEKYALETKDVREPQYSIDLNYIYKHITYHDFVYNNLNPLDLTSIRENSSIKIEFDTDVRSTIKASGNNCNDLLSIYRKHILPNLKYDR